MESRPAAPERVRDLVGALRASRRYASVDRGVLERVAGEALERHARDAEALKAAKRRLHQIHGAYLGPRVPPWDALLADIREARDERALRAALDRALVRHASTRERLGQEAAVGAEILRRVPAPRTVLDLACGLHPLAVPRMGFAPGTHCTALDLDPPMLGLVDGALEVLGVPHRVRAADLAAEVPGEGADLGLLLKSFPSLERQRPGCGEALVRGARVRWMVVSFPTLSLGRRRKGMRETHASRFEAWLARERLSADTFEVPGELFYVVAC